MSTLLNDLARTLSELTGGMSPCRFLVAVSGGLDSMVLLRGLSLVTPVSGWSIEIAHYNHQLRGEASDGDERLVGEVAQNLGFPFHVGSGDVRGRAVQSGVSVEMAAREMRYDFLGKVSAAVGANFIVTAHHADDQVEHLWMRLLRGVEGHGLELMKPMARVPNLPVPLLRPLLGVKRDELLEWGRKEHVEWREDASNADEGVPRNWVRHRLLPIFAEGAALPLTELTRRVGRFLEEQLEAVEMMAGEWLAAPATRAWRDLPLAVRKEAVRIRLMEAGLQTTRGVVVALAGEADVSVSVWSVGAEERLYAVRWDSRVGRVCVKEAAVGDLDFSRDCVRVDLQEGGNLEFGGVAFAWSFESAVQGKPSAAPAFFDADTVGVVFTLRHWQAGDRFHKLGMEEESKLQDLFVNSRVPAADRRGLVLIEAEDGSIVWVERLGVCHPCRIRPQTARVLKLRWERRSK